MHSIGVTLLTNAVLIYLFMLIGLSHNHLSMHEQGRLKQYELISGWIVVFLWPVSMAYVFFKALWQRETSWWPGTLLSVVWLWLVFLGVAAL